MGIDHGSFSLRIGTPEHVYDAFPMTGDGLNDGIGKLFPAMSGVRGGFVGAYRQYGIEQQHALFRPSIQVTAVRIRSSRIGLYFLENIDERRGERDAVIDRKAQSVGLSFSVIGILSDDDDPDVLRPAFVQRPEDITSRREDTTCGVFPFNEIDQIGKIGFFELVSQQGFPFGRDFDIHDRKIDKIDLACNVTKKRKYSFSR